MILEEFLKKVFETDDPFTLTGNLWPSCSPWFFVFLQHRLKNGIKLVYGARSCNAMDYIIDGNEIQLVAIVSEKNVYVPDEYFFGAIDLLPENVIPLDKYVQSLNELMKGKIFYDYINSLPLQHAEPKWQWRSEARERVLHNMPDSEPHFVSVDISEQEVLDMICNKASFNEVALNRIRECEEHYLSEKARVAWIRRAIEEETLAEPWEMDMAEGLRKAPHAKCLMVAFRKNGKEDTGKINYNKVFDLLCAKNAVFGIYDFSTEKAGKRLFDNLGVKEGTKNVLTCRDIVKITYGGKTLYEKTAASPEEESSQN